MREGSAIAVIGAVIVAVLLFCLLGGGLMGWGMMGAGHTWWWDVNRVGIGWGVGMMMVMMLFWIVVIVGVVLGVVWLIRQSGSSSESVESGRDHALSILRERYARGEISKEEFDRIQRDLE